MRYHGRINYVKCHEWGLNVAQGALFDLLNESSAWAKTHIVGNEVYYWVSRNKVLDELPVVYKKSDTVYRNLKVLEDKGLIVYLKEGVKDLVALTEKGKTWNAKINSDINPSKAKEDKDSDINPSKLGNKSENTAKNTDINPTDKDTNHKSTSNKNTIAFDDFWNAYDKKVDTAKCKAKWKRLTLQQQQEIMENVNPYVAANSVKQYRKNPLTYLNGSCWLDDIEQSQPTNTFQGNTHAAHQPANSQYQPKQSSADIYAAKLAEQRRQRDEAANAAATGCDRGNVYDMEEAF